MADAQTLASYLVDIGFRVDAGQQRRMQESVAKVKSSVDQFSRSTHQSTTLLGQFFSFFRRSEGPMRQHTETTQKLTKSFEDFGVSLKKVAEVVAAGALTKALIDLNQQFEQLHYQAEAAGTTVTELAATQFGFKQIGVQAGEITGFLESMAHSLRTIPGAANVLASLGIDIEKFIDPATGKIKDMVGAMNALLPVLEKLFETQVGAARARATLGSIDIPIGPGLERALTHPGEIDKAIEQQKEYISFLTQHGIDYEKAGREATELDNKFRQLLGRIEAIAVEWGEPLIKPLLQAIDWAKGGLDELDKAAEAAFKGMKEAFQQGGFEGLGRYITQGLDAIDWNEEGARISQKIIDGIVAGFRTAAVQGDQDKVREALAAFIKGAFDQAMNDLRAYLQQFPLLRWFPGVGQPQGGGAQAPAPAPSAPGGQDPGSGVALTPYQHGGIVPTTGPAMLHAGEGVVTADAMSGLSRLGPTIEDLWDGFRNWWFGAGGYRPGVVISNVDELADAIWQASPIKDQEGYPGKAGGEGPRGRMAIGAPREPVPGTAGGPHGGSSQPGAEYKFGAFNVGNIGAGPGRQNFAFGSPEEGIKAIASWMQRNMDRGYDTLTKLINRYSPPNENQTNELIARAARVAHVDPNQRLGPENIHDLVTATILNEWGGRFPAGYNQALVDKALGGGPALGTTSNYRAGDKTVTLNAQNNFNITGADALSVGGALNSAQSRINADLIRNLTPIVQ